MSEVKEERKGREGRRKFLRGRACPTNNKIVPASLANGLTCSITPCRMKAEAN